MGQRNRLADMCALVVLVALIATGCSAPNDSPVGVAAQPLEEGESPFSLFEPYITDLHCLRCHALADAWELDTDEEREVAVSTGYDSNTDWPYTLEMPHEEGAPGYNHPEFTYQELTARPPIDLDLTVGSALVFDEVDDSDGDGDPGRKCTTCHDYTTNDSSAWPNTHTARTPYRVRPGSVTLTDERSNCDGEDDQPGYCDRITVAPDDDYGHDFWGAAPSENLDTGARPDMIWAHYDSESREWCVEDMADICAGMLESLWDFLRQPLGQIQNAENLRKLFRNHMAEDGRVLYAVRQNSDFEGADPANYYWIHAVELFYDFGEGLGSTDIDDIVAAWCPEPAEESNRCGGHAYGAGEKALSCCAASGSVSTGDIGMADPN